MIQRSSLSSRICGTAALVLLTCGAARLHAAAPGAVASRTDTSAADYTVSAPAEEPVLTVEEQAQTAEEQARTSPAPDDRSKRARHLAPRGRSQHTFFANAGYTAIMSTIY
ncbi:MAG: hypothetical protein LUH46_09775, partial [Alistipes sp.]|nr:hypothetical protein [Alistipes sp.]